MANLPFEETQRQYNIQFLCTSNDASSVEMSEGVVDQLNRHCGDGFLAFDAHTREEVFVIPCVMYIIADTPMASNLCCVMQQKAIHPCRLCSVSSQLKNKDAVHEWFLVSTCRKLYITQSIDSDTFLQEGVPRSWGGTNKLLKELYLDMVDGMNKTNFDKKCTKFGISCLWSKRFFDHFYANRNKPPAKGNDTSEKKAKRRESNWRLLRSVCKTSDDTWKNILLSPAFGFKGTFTTIGFCRYLISY